MDSRSTPTERSRSDLCLDKNCPTLEEVRFVLGAQSTSPVNARKIEENTISKRNGRKKKQEREGDAHPQLRPDSSEVMALREVTALQKEVKQLQTMNTVLWNDNSRMHQIIMQNLSHNACFNDK